MDACAKVLVWSEDNLGELILFLHHVGSRYQIRHGPQECKRVPSLNYIASPVYFVKWGLTLYSHHPGMYCNLIQPWDYRHGLLHLS